MVCACAHGLKIGPQSRRGAQCAPVTLWQILLWHIPQSPGTVKTVPYRVFYNAWQALKCAVGRGALTTPQPCPAAHYKICDNPHTGPCRIFCIIIHHKLPHGHPLQNTKNPPHARL